MLVPGIVSATFKTESVDYVIDIAVKNRLSAVEWSENHHIKKEISLLRERQQRRHLLPVLR